jgi:hypothetical protein
LVLKFLGEKRDEIENLLSPTRRDRPVEYCFGNRLLTVVRVIAHIPELSPEKYFSE